MSNENEFNKEQENKISELERENKALKEMLCFDLLHPWEGIFVGKARTFPVESYDDFKNYLNALNKIENEYASTVKTYKYRLESAIDALFLSLLNNEKYKEMDSADFEATELLKILKRNNLSQKNKSTAMRHCKIDNDTYLENVEIFSPYFNTLKKYNPELKTEEVKLINEISGKKKVVASKLEKLQRGQGLLTAYKNYTPQEAAQYPDSFNFYTILHDYKNNDSLGRYHRYNKEALDYYLSSGTETFRDIMKGAEKYTYNIIFNFVNNSANSSYYWNSPSIFERIYENIEYSGDIPFNNIFPVWEISVKTLKEDPNETLESWKNQKTINGNRLFGLMMLYMQLTRYNLNVYSFRNLLSLDLNYISEKEIRTLLLNLKCIEDVMVKNLVSINSVNVNSYDSKQRVSRICTNLTYANYVFSEALISKSTEFVDEIMEYYNKAKNNEKIKEFINSDKYWTDFCTPITTDRTTFSKFNFSCDANNSKVIGFLDKKVWKEFMKSLEKF